MLIAAPKGPLVQRGLSAKLTGGLSAPLCKGSLGDKKKDTAITVKFSLMGK